MAGTEKEILTALTQYRSDQAEWIKVSRDIS
jgi:hypothetical protein